MTMSCALFWRKVATAGLAYESAPATVEMTPTSAVFDLKIVFVDVVGMVLISWVFVMTVGPRQKDENFFVEFFAVFFA